MSHRTMASYVRDAIVDQLEPALIRYIETSLRSAYGDDWEEKGLGDIRAQFEKNRLKRTRPYSDEPSSVLGFGNLDVYRSIIFLNPTIFLDWPWSNTDTQRIFSNLVDVRDPASHGGTDLSNDNARTGFINVRKVLEMIDPLAEEEVERIEADAFGFAEKLAISPLCNISLARLVDRQLVDREAAYTELKGKIKQKYARAICVTGRGGVGKTALVKKYVQEVIEDNDDNYELVFYLSAKQQELRGEG